MTDLLSLLQPLGLSSSAFAPTSRYHGVATAQMTESDGRVVTYVTRRVVPQPDGFATLQLVTVHEGDRLDLLAAQYIGDPLAFWRLCDANGAIRPDELTDVPGSVFRVTLPSGIPGAGNA
jgi:hypothetical protein